MISHTSDIFNNWSPTWIITLFFVCGILTNRTILKKYHKFGFVLLLLTILLNKVFIFHKNKFDYNTNFYHIYSNFAQIIVYFLLIYNNYKIYKSNNNLILFAIIICCLLIICLFNIYRTNAELTNLFDFNLLILLNVTFTLISIFI